LVIARFRQERDADPDAPVADLVARTTATAGRTVLISGLAGGAAIGGLVAFADPLLGAMALGGAVAVLLATLAGLTAVPALIATAHRRIPGPRDSTRILRLRRAVAAKLRRRAEPGLLARLAAVAQNRPAPVALTVTIGLLALSLP